MVKNKCDFFTAFQKAKEEGVLDKFLVDPFDGLNDLKNKVIRHTNDKTFVEDSLRVYRAAQFAARLEFSIHPDTIKLAKSMDLSNLPKERVYEEFQKMLLSSNKPSIGLQALDDMGVVDRYYPEIAALKNTPQRNDFHAEGNVWIHTQMVLDKAANIIKRFSDEKDKQAIILAALCHDLGKPSTTKISAKGYPVQPGHEEAGVKPTLVFLNKLTNDAYVLDNVPWIVEHHLLPMHLHRAKAGMSSFRRIINRYGLKKLELLAAVSEADVTGRFHKIENRLVQPSGDEIDWFRENIKKASEKYGVTQEGKIALLITGDDLISIGFKEGPEIGRVLREIKEQQEEGNLDSAESALRYVREHWLKKQAFSGIIAPIYTDTKYDVYPKPLDEDELKMDIKKQLNLNCQECDADCSCVFTNGCQCAHDCLCSDAGLADNKIEDIIVNVQELCK